MVLPRNNLLNSLLSQLSFSACLRKQLHFFNLVSPREELVMGVFAAVRGLSTIEVFSFHGEFH